MHRLFLLFLSCLFLGCADKEPLLFSQKDASQLKGLWRGELHPYRFWHFSDGVLHQQVFFAGQEILEHWYGYETKNDSLFLREMTQPEKIFVFTVHFENDSTAVLTDAIGTVNVNYRIKRF